MKPRIPVLRNTLSRITLALAVACLCTAGSVAPAGAELAPKPGTVFNADKMAAVIKTTMDPIVTGYAYTIARNGQVVKEKGGGWARAPGDGSIAFDPNQRNNIASVSKTFTAVAIMQLIERNKSKGVTVNSQISPYLPVGWTMGPYVNDLTFADLLTHRSGFDVENFNGNSYLGYEAVRGVIAGGTTQRPAEGKRPRAYKNLNYALLRVLMAGLWAKTGDIKLAKEGDLGIYKTMGDYNSALYISYMQSHVFDPISISNVKCYDEGTKATLYYKPGGGTPGVVAVDQSKYCGSGGLYLSSHELAKFFVYFFNTETLVSKDVRQQMIDNRFGLDGGNTDKGLSLSRNGDVGMGGGAGTRACMMHFPDNVDAAIVENSATVAPQDMCSLLTSAYNAGWK